VDAEQSLYDAISALRDNDIRRLLVVDSLTGNPLYVLTYKRILRFLQQCVSTADRRQYSSISLVRLAQVRAIQSNCDTIIISCIAFLYCICANPIKRCVENNMHHYDIQNLSSLTSVIIATLRNVYIAF